MYYIQLVSSLILCVNLMFLSPSSKLPYLYAVHANLPQERVKLNVEFELINLLFAGWCWCLSVFVS